MFAMGTMIQSPNIGEIIMAKARGMSVKDRTGDRYGRLVVVSRAENHVEPSGAIRAKWNCLCDCGGSVTVTGTSLAKGNTRSCGCMMREKEIKHGMSNAPIYRVWNSMRQRCTNPNIKAYKSYGGRGVTVCDEWLQFENFYRDMGDPPHPGMTLERIDNDKGYHPGNVRWATRLEQASNRRTNVHGNYTGISVITFHGQKRTLQEWSEKTGIALENLRSRLNRGWSVENTLITPVQPYAKHGFGRRKMK